MVQKNEENKKSFQDWEISTKHEILTVQKKQLEIWGNKTKISINTNSYEINLEAWRLNTANMRTNKYIDK